MSGQRRLMIGVAASTSVLGLVVTSGLLMLASRLVEEFSHPHVIPDIEEFNLTLPYTVPEPPRSLQRPVTFQTSDGKIICGDFWAQLQPAPTVVLCHGYRSSRAQLRPGAALEYKLGYNILFFDFRGHGDSDSVTTSGGNAEVRDLEAAIAVASMQPETLPNKIIIHGFSMGAAIALLTPPHSEVAAIVADSPFARSDDILRRLVHYRLTHGIFRTHPRMSTLSSVIAWATIGASVLVFRLRFGHSFVARPDTAFKRWVAQARKTQQFRHTPILLIHASGDELIPVTHAHQLVAQAQAHNIPLETYFVAYCIHCGAYLHNPEQYTAVMQDFLARHLEDNFPRQKAC